MTIEERLAAMEREVSGTKEALRRTRRMLAAGVLTALGALSLAAMKSPQVVRAEGFIVTDGNGHDLASLGLRKGRPDLTMLDERGKIRVDLQAGVDGSFMRLIDSSGKIRAALASGNGGEALTEADENGRVRVGLGSFQKGGPNLTLFNGIGKTVWKTH